MAVLRQEEAPGRRRSGDGVEVKPAELAVSSSLPGDKATEIRLRRGRSLVVEPGFDASYLHALLAVLESEG